MAICKAFELQFSEELERGESEIAVLFLRLTTKAYSSPEHLMYQLQACPYNHIFII